jgi:membrane fusion protein (multidrug efflux system)
MGLDKEHPLTLRLRFLMFGSLAIVGCARKDPPPPPPPEVLVVPVVQRDVPVFGEWIGTLDGSVNADIRP